MTNIKFPIQMYDPTRDYYNFQEKYQEQINKVLEKGNFINGEQVGELEKRLAEYVNVKHCITVANGTDALQIALMAIDIKPDDEIITVAYTWISTSESISILRAKPVFIDIEDQTFNMDPNLIEAAITNKTKAILPVSLYGQMPDYDKINEIAEKYNLVVIEDGAQSFGGTQNNKKSCGVTKISTTSFFPTKPLGCYGDGGALFTDDDNLALKIRAIKAHGGIKRFTHEYIGVNSRLDTIHAGILHVKLDNFEDCLEIRNEVACYYSINLQNVPHLKIPEVLPNNTSAWAQYSLITPNKEIRDYLVEELKKNKINVAIFYPVPLHYQKCFEYLGYKKGDLPVSENISDTILNIPCYAELTQEEQNYIINTLKLLCNKL